MYAMSRSRLRRNLRTLSELFDVRYLNAPSTVRTSIGFLRSLFGKTPGDAALEEIFNFLPLTPRIGTAGQPKPAQLPAIRDAGYRHVINLAPHNAENAIRDEQQLVEGLGLTYVHIPVDFRQPAEEDFNRFCAAMEAVQSERVFVHCAANMRVSAFLYRYRRDVLGENDSVARADLERIWKPFGAWQAFLER